MADQHSPSSCCTLRPQKILSLDGSSCRRQPPHSREETQEAPRTHCLADGSPMPSDIAPSASTHKARPSRLPARPRHARGSNPYDSPTCRGLHRRQPPTFDLAVSESHRFADDAPHAVRADVSRGYFSFSRTTTRSASDGFAAHAAGAGWCIICLLTSRAPMVGSDRTIQRGSRSRCGHAATRCGWGRRRGRCCLARWPFRSQAVRS